MTNTPPIWTRAEIESPCVKICVIHPETRLCTGCARSIDECRAKRCNRNAPPISACKGTGSQR